MKRRQSGFTLLEMMISLGIVAILSTVGVVSYVNYTENAETADALTKMSVIREQIQARQKMNQNALATCDDSMFSGVDLDDPFLDLSITSIPLDESDLSKGYGAGVVVSAQADAQGAQGVKMAKVLHDSLLAQKANISGAILTDSVVSYAVLLTNPGERVCDPGGQTQVAAAGPTSSAGAAGPTSLAAAAQPPAATSGPPAMVTMATAPALPASVANAQPPVPVSDPPAPSQANALPTCPSGQQISVMFVGGVSKQVCAKTCGARQILDASGTCKAIDGPAPMCTAPCFDSYMGNCATEFQGLCSESYISDVCQKTCGMCGSGVAAKVPCSTLATIEGSNPQAPILPAWQPRFVGHVPTQYGQTITVTADDIVKNMGAVSPDGSSAIKVTNMEFAPRSGGRPPPRYHRIVRTDDGSWGVTRTSNAPESNEFEIMVTLDNGHGETIVSTWWSSAG